MHNWGGTQLPAHLPPAAFHPQGPSQSPRVSLLGITVSSLLQLAPTHVLHGLLGLGFGQVVEGGGACDSWPLFCISGPLVAVLPEKGFRNKGLYFTPLANARPQGTPPDSPYTRTQNAGYRLEQRPTASRTQRNPATCQKQWYKPPQPRYHLPLPCVSMWWPY